MSGPYDLLKPLIFGLDPERAHTMTLRALKAGLIPCPAPYNNPALAVDLWGLKFPNPVGLAAGFDKNAEVIAPMLKMGFGFVEAGGVTPEPQDGLPKPRVFRCTQHEAVINRMDFPNIGAKAFKRNIEKYRNHPLPGDVGVQIAKGTKQIEPEKDFRALIRTLGPVADYIVFNVSCPNTPGLVDLQSRDMVLRLSEEILEERRQSCGSRPPPLLIKLSPDLSDDQIEKVSGAVVESGIDGMILTNTSTARPGYLPADFAERKGGLSGAPVQEKSTASIRNFYRLTGGKVPIIGVGGVFSGRDAYDKIRAGASLVQLYTGLVYRGPGVARSINCELAALLQADGYSHVSQAVGADAK